MRAIFGRVQTLAHRPDDTVRIRPGRTRRISTRWLRARGPGLPDRPYSRSGLPPVPGLAERPALMVAECEGMFAGYALVLFRGNASASPASTRSASLPQFLPDAASARRCCRRRERRRWNATARPCGSRCTRRTRRRSRSIARSGYRQFGRSIRTTTRTAGPRCGSRSGFQPRLSAARSPAALFPPNHRVHVWTGLRDDGAGLGRPVIAADTCPGIQAVA